MAVDDGGLLEDNIIQYASPGKSPTLKQEIRTGDATHNELEPAEHHTDSPIKLTKAAYGRLLDKAVPGLPRDFSRLQGVKPLYPLPMEYGLRDQVFKRMLVVTRHRRWS